MSGASGDCEYPEYPATYASFERYVYVVSKIERDSMTSQMDASHLGTFSDADAASNLARECSARTEEHPRKHTTNWIDVRRVKLGRESATDLASGSLAKEPCPIVYD
jgi:hypothetical protein